MSENRYQFLLGRMYFTSNDGYQNCLVFDPLLSSLTLDNINNFTYCILTRVLPEKVKPFDTNLALTMPNLADDKVRQQLYFKSSVLVQKILLHFIEFFFCLIFLSQAFTIHRTAGERVGYIYNSSLRLSTTSQTLGH